MLRAHCAHSRNAVNQPRRFARFGLVIGLLALAACSDEEPGGVKTPELPEMPQGTAAAINCTAVVRTRQIMCGSEAAALARGEGVMTAGRGGGLWSGVSTQAMDNDSVLMVGGQNLYVKLTSSNLV